MRGTKNPDLAAIRALRRTWWSPTRRRTASSTYAGSRSPASGSWVTDIETVPAGGRHVRAALRRRARLGPPGLAGRGPRAAGAAPLPPVTRQGRDRDLARPVDGGRLGERSPVTWCAGSAGRTSTPSAADRYPHVELADLDGAGADVVLLPDEPYVFTAEDGPEAFARTPTELVSGRLLTWYGPSLVERLASPDPEPLVVDREEVVVRRASTMIRALLVWTCSASARTWRCRRWRSWPAYFQVLPPSVDSRIRTLLARTRCR